MTTKRYLRLGRLTALISFLLGSSIFLIYFFTSDGFMVFVGFWFVEVAAIVNSVILIAIILRSVNDHSNQKKLAWTAALMLLNIPVMLFYSMAADVLLNTMRITFTNSTSTVLTDIRVVGCEQKHIERLEVGSSATVWIGIPADCAVEVNYLSEGHQKNDQVVGYVTNGAGQKISYKLGGRNPEF